MAALEIIALDTVTPQLRAPGTGDTYSAPRALALTPETLTGSAATSGLSLTQTWNTTGTPALIYGRVTDTASNAASLLLDLGTAAGGSLFNVSKAGRLRAGDGAYNSPAYSFTASTADGILRTSSKITFQVGSAYIAAMGAINAGVDPGLAVGSTGGLGWASTGDPAAGSIDLALWRDAANTLALRRGVNAQAFRVYTTYTDASNHSRLAITGAAITLETAGTGADDIDLTLTPAGTGTLKFGTHSALAAETVTGYITIKDAGGTTRKLAVVS